MNVQIRHRLRFVAALLLSLALFPGLAAAQAFDHRYQAWTALLVKHVQWNAQGTESTVDYAGFKQDRGELKKVLDALSGVSQAEYDGFSKGQKLAFLINAYNAFTVELILTKYPDLESIRDLGGLFSGSPWKKEFFTLLGEERHLDWVEHGMIRKPGAFDDPRIHWAVNCASIGCPALRTEAFFVDMLDAQLDDGERRFFSDRTRNYYDKAADELKVTKLLDWYEEDFTQGFRGVSSVKGFLARYAKQLSDDPAIQARIAAQEIDVDFADYDWKLNKR